jgi:hypothetical protein
MHYLVKPFAIQLSEGKAPRVQVLRVGKFSHPKYGEFEITSATLAEMKKNFDAKIRGIDLAFDYFHDSDKVASGWPTQLALEEGGKELWADVDWTPTASKMLAEREVRYFSPDFAFRWKDPETGATYNNVLFGGGLTNRPFVKDMAAIVADEKGADEMDTIESLKADKKNLEKQLKLSEDKVEAVEKQMTDLQPKAEKVASLESQIAALQAELAKLKGENEVAMSEKKKLEEKVALSEKEGKFNLMLSEGKAVAAQKEAYMKGDLDAFAKLAEPINLSGKGNGGGTGEGKEKGDREDRVIKLAEQKRKENPKLSHGDSLSLANKEIKE